jgi:DNA-directed RNA polymerase specialized sigma24 family protein
MTSQLTDQVRAGSLADFGPLFERYRWRATDYARRLMSQPTDADEVVADAFERVLDIMRRGLGPDDDGFWC